MKAKLSNVLMILGCGLMAAALVLFLHNRQEQLRAAEASQEAISKVVDVILREQSRTKQQEPVHPQNRIMTVSQIDGYGYIGFLGIAGLELELPVMADWSYPQLQIAPCRYSGSIFTDDLVIMAHNYPKHFGKLKEMALGDMVTFTDMDGTTISYQVVALEILPPDAVEETTSGEYDLTLFTCTYGGENRVLLRCDRQHA